MSCRHSPDRRASPLDIGASELSILAWFYKGNPKLMSLSGAETSVNVGARSRRKRQTPISVDYADAVSAGGAPFCLSILRAAGRALAGARASFHTVFYSV